MKKSKNILRRGLLIVILVVWVLYLVIRWSSEYKVFSIFEIFVFLFVAFLIGYCVGRYVIENEIVSKMEYELDKKDEQIEELKEEIRFAEEERRELEEELFEVYK